MQMEVPNKTEQGTTEYTYTDLGVFDEQAAQKEIQKLKEIGCGGRSLRMDGSPDGVIAATWGSVERTASAEKIETEALKN